MSCCPPGAYQYLAADHDDEGSIKTADDVSYYQVGKGKNGLIICPDIWGWNGGRTRAVADDFAKRGMNVYVPKILEPFEEGTDGDGFAPTFNIMERMPEFAKLVAKDAAWNTDVAVPKLIKVIDAMKEDGVRRIALLGVCYGAWPGMKVCAEVSEIVCAATLHPSIHVEGMVGGDPAALAEASKCPWAFFPTGPVGGEGADPDIYDENGSVFQALEKNFKGKNLTKRYANVSHGFAMRGNIKEGEFNIGRGEDVKAAVCEVMLDLARFYARFRMCRLEKSEVLTPLRKPKFGKVKQLNPDSKGLNLMLKVVKCEEDTTASAKTWDVVAGDDTGIVTLRIVDEGYSKTCAEGASIRLQNARILMVKGFIRVIIDKWGVLRPVDAPHEFEINMDHEMSGTEYELK